MNARPGSPSTRRRERIEGPGERDTPQEWIWQGALTLIAAVLFASTFSSHVALGDAPESVAGVRTLGVLHAPGYPTYVLLAKAFGTVLPFGSWAFRVNLFSLVCAALAVGVVFRLARHFGASRIGGSVGALGLATAVSFWFNADFAKYYAVTTLMLAGAALGVVIWEERGSTAALVVSGLLLGASVGSGWQLAAIMTLAVATLVAFGRRRPTRAAVIGAVASLVVVAVVGLVYVLVRAAQDPTLNWGAASNPSRLVGLVMRHDFGGTVSGKVGAVTERVATLFGGLERDFGAVVAVLFACGVAELVRRRLDPARVAFLAIAAGVNLVAVAIGSGVTQMWGFENVVVGGGYLLATMIVIAVVVAVGTTGAVDFVGRAMAQRSDSDDDAPAERARVLPAMVAAALLAAVVVPSVVVHRAHASLKVAPLADAYGHRVLEQLPRHAVLLVWGEEYSMPMLYRQLVDHERRDVTIVSANAVGLDWGRAQLTQRLHLGDALRLDSADKMVERMIASIQRTRPVFLDVTAMHVLEPFVAYRTDGYVGEVVAGKAGPRSVTDVDAVAAMVKRSDTADGLDHEAYRRLVWKTVYAFHERAHLELAKAYALQDDIAAATAQVRLANGVNPVDGATLAKLRTMSAKDAKAFILTL
ncbi:MAG TPA: DUF2723 domain-containing protein [Acidimicrobiia bacterium]|nr:DUF2723 domain-containing protein [Acidimicrobiia bacterium]